MCHMYMSDFAYDGPLFLVPLSLSYPSAPVYVLVLEVSAKEYLVKSGWVIRSLCICLVSSMYLSRSDSDVGGNMLGMYLANK